MINIKLWGSFKIKKIILVILIIMAVGIISYNGFINKQNKKSESNISNIEEESIIKPTEESRYNDEEKQIYDEVYNLFFSKKYDEAISKADVLLKYYPDSYMGYNIRGIAKAYNGNFDEGMKDIDESLKINSEYGYARFNKALTYELYGDMDKAMEWYIKALEIEDYVWSYYGIASIYARKGNVEETMKYLNKAIELDSNVKEVAKDEEDFNAVKNSEEFKKSVYN